MVCDRASVFLVDIKKNELWTKVAKGVSMIRIPIGQGLVGHVASKGEPLNILDAHQDYRFNREIDKKNNYRTKSVLCVPIYDKERKNIIGVLQAINKKNEEYFTKDDEGMAFILADIASVVLKNSIYHDEKLAFNNTLTKLMNINKMIN